MLHAIEPSPLDKLPPNFLHDIEAARDRIVAKAAQLVQNKTTNITENFISIRCKMDGGNTTIGYNRDHSSIVQWQLHSMSNLVQVGQHQY